MRLYTAQPLTADRPDPARALRSPDVRWHEGELDRAGRWQALGQRGVTVWMTGLPGSGKSTIAHGLERALVEAGRFAYVLDGDNVRHGLSGDLGFDDAARTENVRRVAHVARLFADAGAVAVVSLVSPFAADRGLARALHGEARLEFLEVFVDTPLEECERRDPKGLYARARAGELANLTGRGSPYEPPAAPELTLHAADEPVERCIRRLLDALAPALA
jgi:bifunctional enzyme CysN/CysC